MSDDTLAKPTRKRAPSFRAELKVLAVLAIFIGALEGYARYKAPTLDYDREHIHQFSTIADELAAAPKEPKKVLFFGNSLMMHGANMEIIKQTLDNQHLATTAKITPVGTAIADWTYLYKRYIEAKNADPDILVLGFVRHHISDDEPLKPRRLARHFVAQKDLPQLWTQDMSDYHIRTQSTLSHYSALFGDQPTHQSGILYMLCDEYSNGVSKNNQWVQEQAERRAANKPQVTVTKKEAQHWRLKRFIKMMKQQGVLVYFVPMPQPEMYNLDPKIIEIVESNGMKWIDAREVCLGEENFSDGYHMGKKGIPKFTKWICEKLMQDLK